MLARGVTLEQLEQAAREVGVRLTDGGTYPSKPPAETRPGQFRFVLKTDSGRFGIAHGGRGGAPYRRRTRKGGTAPGRVCWHGHRDFLRALFRLAPDAYVRTTMATYKSARDFERSFPETYWERAPYMGYYMQAPADQACTCDERGRV